MQLVHAQNIDYRILISDPCLKKKDIKAFFRNKNGTENMWLISPQHGRSYLVDKRNNKYIISKGNGLSFSEKYMIQTPELPQETWGILYEDAAIRDYKMGNEISALGIKTNRMEAVIGIELNLPFYIPVNKKAALLQYSVECPYRISDAAFMTKNQIISFVEKWSEFNDFHARRNYEIAANILIRNLYIMHNNKILHNALSSQNITWSLELLDFELACSPSFPYEKEENRKCISQLFSREIIHTYQIILDIAGILKERVDYNYIDDLFLKYGFKII